jgi:hypothetical protein
LKEGVFSLPCATIIYTHQCWAEVKLARRKVDPDLEEVSIEEIEEAFTQHAGVNFNVTYSAPAFQLNHRSVPFA